MPLAQPLFTPGGQTFLITVGTTSSSVNVNPNAPFLRLLNTGTNLCFVRIGTGPQTATLTDYPLVPNNPEIVAKGVGADTIAAITTGASNPLYVTPGG